MEQPLIEGYLDYSQSHRESANRQDRSLSLCSFREASELYGKWMWRKTASCISTQVLLPDRSWVTLLCSSTPILLRYGQELYLCADITLTSFNAMYFNVKWGDRSLDLSVSI